MAVEVDISGTFSATAPSALFENSFVADIAAGGGGNPNYDASPDGRHFVFVEDLSAGSTSQELRVVLNWHQELLERVPLP